MTVVDIGHKARDWASWGLKFEVISLFGSSFDCGLITAATNYVRSERLVGIPRSRRATRGAWAADCGPLSTAPPAGADLFSANGTEITEVREGSAATRRDPGAPAEQLNPGQVFGVNSADGCA
jgi:hypothetical protein